MTTAKLVLAAAEWEPLSLGDEWQFDLRSDDQLPQDGSTYTTISLTRDAAWQLLAQARGERTSQGHAPQVTPLRAGQMVTPLPELFCGTVRATATLRDVYFGDYTSNMEGSATRIVRPQQATIVFGAMDEALRETRSCSVWCLNGPPADFPFSLTTQRSVAERVIPRESEQPDRQK